MIDERYIIPYRESAADVVIEQHIAKGGLTGPWFPSIEFDVENVADQADEKAQLDMDIADGIIWGIAGVSFRVTEGAYAGRQIEPDSSQILDLNLINTPGAVYHQPDFSILLSDQDARPITGDVGIPSFFLNRLTGPIFLRDPFVVPTSKKIKAVCRFYRNAGVVGVITMQFFGTLLYGAGATAR